MRIYIVIPAHNEEDNIGKTLESMVNQHLKPTQLVIVNDNSTDRTREIANDFSQQHSWIQLVNKKSSKEHLPGVKIIEAFYKGYQILDQDYDVICKFDADMVFEEDYLMKLSQHFKENKRLGMVSGQCYIQKDYQWVLENLNKDDHIRGSLKAYRKACFLEIGKIAKSIGWDTLDELMAQYYGWELKVDPSLKVKHLKPTGFKYSPGAAKLQGVATFRMRLGLILTLIIGLKRTWLKRDIRIFFNYIKGFLQAKRKKIPFIVDSKQGKFLRNYRWKGIFQRFKS
ncbi:MAG: glycosyltransferase [Flavobacteriaceae bacterium]